MLREVGDKAGSSFDGQLGLCFSIEPFALFYMIKLIGSALLVFLPWACILTPTLPLRYPHPSPTSPHLLRLPPIAFSCPSSLPYPPYLSLSLFFSLSLFLNLLLALLSPFILTLLSTTSSRSFSPSQSPLLSPLPPATPSPMHHTRHVITLTTSSCMP